MYYVIESEYVGPISSNETLDNHWVFIQTEPGRTNSSNEPREEGWLGNTNNVSVYARGAFGTLEEAKSFIAKEFGKCRFDDEWEYGGVVVAAYTVGEFERVSYDAAETWMFDGLEYDVNHRLSEDEIASLAEFYIREARESNYRMDISAHAQKIIEQYVEDFFPEDDE